MKHVRAGKEKGDTLSGEHRWFHLGCYRSETKGWGHPIDFPAKANSDHTTCHGCGTPINHL